MPSTTDDQHKKLLEKLCIELRYVGCFDKELPESKKAIEHIMEIQNIARELQLKSISPDQRLKQLTEETKWLMNDLYYDCLQYPKVIPYVRLLDGQTRVEVIRQKQQKIQKERDEAFAPTAKKLTIIINKHTSGDQRQELHDLLEKRLLRHVAYELDQIKQRFTRDEKKFVEDFFSSVF